RPDRRIFLVLAHGGVIEGAQEIAARLKLTQETLVVDIETERLGGGVEIGAVNEQGHFFRFGFHDCSRVRSSKLRYRRLSRAWTASPKGSIRLREQQFLGDPFLLR